jgi:molybdate transport system regulatory protein
MARSPRASVGSSIRVRILSGSEIAIGPGKEQLLAAIEETGSISAAARRMRMSYRRARLLVHTMNECFARPLVEAVKGGRAGGGAALTDEGRQVLALYREIADLAARTFEPRMRPPKRRRRSA